MKKTITTAMLALSLAVPGLALACEGMMKSSITTVSIEDAKASKMQFVDANSASTRTKHGIIPGAILLTSHDQFDAAKELPTSKDAKLVFYCANDQCSASTVAAKRAMKAGYTNVAVLPDGIMGWKKAGMQTAAASTKAPAQS